MNETLGIKHIALKVKNFADCLNFYTKLLGMSIDWQPDNENAYLTNGRGNLALHMDESLDLKSKHNRLDHFGIMMKEKDDVDDWFKFISSKNITIYKKLQDHRDGSRSFYCYDPDLNIVQFLWHPKLNK